MSDQQLNNNGNSTRFGVALSKASAGSPANASVASTTDPYIAAYGEHAEIFGVGGPGHYSPKEEKVHV